MEEENMLMTPTLESATPRSLLENVLVPAAVQATVKARKQRKRRSVVSKDARTKRVSIVPDDKDQESLDVSITPRTALLGAMNASKLMRTVHHPKRKKIEQPGGKDETPEQSKSLVQSEHVEDTHVVHARLHAFGDFTQSQPVISTDEYSSKLQEKLAAFKKAKAEAAVRRNQSQVKDQSTGSIVQSDDTDENRPTFQAHEENTIVQSHEKHGIDGEQSLPGELTSSVENDPVLTNHSKISVHLSEEDVCPSSADNTVQTDQDPLQLSSMHAVSNSATSLAQEDTNENEVTMLNIVSDDNVAGSAQQQQQQQQTEIQEAEYSPRQEDVIRESSAVQNPVSMQLSKPVRKVTKPSLKMANKVKSVTPKRKTASQTGIPISSAQLKGIVQHFSTRKVSKDALEEIEKVYGKFFKNLTEDLEAACVHAKRKTITHDDMELIMKRQKYITDSRPLNVLIEENFPLEYQDILIPVAKSCQISTQVQQKKLEPNRQQTK